MVDLSNCRSAKAARRLSQSRSANAEDSRRQAGFFRAVGAAEEQAMSPRRVSRYAGSAGVHEHRFRPERRPALSAVGRRTAKDADGTKRERRSRFAVSAWWSRETAHHAIIPQD